MGIIRRTYYGEMTKEVLICSKEDLLNLTCPDGCKVYIVPTSPHPCEACLKSKGEYRVPSGYRIGDVLSEDQTPQFHPNCRCRIILKIGGKEYNIDSYRLTRGEEGVLVQVSRKPEEILAMSEEEFKELKEELEREFEKYKQQLDWGPLDSIREGKTKMWKRIGEKTGVDLPAIKAESCEERAEYLAKLFELIVERRNLQNYVNIDVVAAKVHAWVEVNIKYVSSSGRLKTIKGRFDPWLEVKWLW